MSDRARAKPSDHPRSLSSHAGLVRAGIAAAIVFAAVFAGVFYGMSFLPIQERSMLPRLGVASLVSGFAAVIVGLLARGGSVASVARMEWDGDALHALWRHRARARRAFLVSALGAIAGGGVTVAAFHFYYAQLNADPATWEQLELGTPELAIGAVAALIVGFVVWRVVSPGPFLEEMSFDRSALPTGEHVEDRELAEIVSKVRAIQRRNRIAHALASLAAAGAATLTLVASSMLYGEAAELTVLDLALALLMGGIAAALVSRVLRSPLSVSDVGIENSESTPAVVETPKPLRSFASTERSEAERGVAKNRGYEEILGSARDLALHRKGGLARWLGAPTAHVVLADDELLGSSTEDASGFRRFLPPLLRPYEAVLRDEDRVVAVLQGDFLDRNVKVRADGRVLGTLTPSALFGRRYRIGELELRGSFFARSTFDVFARDERAGRITKRSMPVFSVLTGVEQVVDVEIHTELALEERTLLIAAALFVDRRYF